MDTEKTLAEIARTVLLSGPESDQKSLREKAGILALLNLLGIVLSFYGDSQAAQSSMGLLSSLALGPAAPAPDRPREPDLLSSIMSLARKLLGASQGQGGIDPGLIGTLMGSLTALSTARSMALRAPAPAPQSSSPDPSGESRTAETQDDSSPEAGCRGEGETGDGGGDVEGGSGNEGSEAPARASAGDAALPQKVQAPGQSQGSQVSPLQQVLGIDPRIITLALNVLADFMKARNAMQSERNALHEGKSNIQNRPSPGDAELTVTPDGKALVIPKARKQPRERLYHKPGIGIYRKRVEEPAK